MNVVIKNLNVSYGDKVIFDDFCYEFKENEITCLLGKSAVGKSTLLNALANLVPYEGEIVVGTISYIFQEDRLVPNLSIGKNLELVLKSVIKDKAERKARVKDMLKKVELLGEEKSIKKELSGGMAHRVNIARAFLYPSDVLLLDEPFKGLDPSTKNHLIKTFLKLYEEEKRTVVFVTHAIDEALLLADRVVMIKDSPVTVADEIEITLPKSERALSDDALAGIRKKLLSCYE